MLFAAQAVAEMLVAEGVPVSDPVATGGWVGTGLLSMVLGWVFLRLIPERDKMNERMQVATAKQLAEVLKSKDDAVKAKDEQIDKILANKDTAMEKVLAKQTEVVEKVLAHCADQMKQSHESSSSQQKELLGAMEKLHLSVREGVHATRNLAQQILTERNLANALQSVEAPVYTKYLDGTLTSWNVAAERLFGWKQGEMVGHSIFLNFIPQNKRKEEETILLKISQGETLEEYMSERVCKDGTVLRVFLLTSPIRDQSGKVQGASTIVRLPH